MPNSRTFMGDCLGVMRKLANDGTEIQSIVTDPPYGISFMGRDWDHGIPGKSYWKAAFDLLPPGGHLLAFSGARTYHRMASVIEDAGFEIRDQVMWITGTGFPKSHNLNGKWQGWGTALKPAHEPICVARKPLIGTVAQNVQEFGVGAINIDACRVGEGVLRSTSNGKRDRTDGYGMQGGVIGDSELGRWPANVAHDGSDEVEAAFAAFGNKGGGFGIRGGNREMKFGMGAGGIVGFGDAGTASRFFYCAKASKLERNGSKHPTVKPISLMQWLVRMVTPPGGTVLDPFAGTGTTLAAGLLEGFNVIGIEKDPEYYSDIRRRLTSLQAEMTEQRVLA